MLETRETPSRTTVMERSPVELVPRATDSCGVDGAACRKPTSTATLPIVLAVVYAYRPPFFILHADCP
jgi:hypothetical protein